MEINQALSMIRTVSDFPIAGVEFKDITPLLADADALNSAISALSHLDAYATKVAGIEARGFILASAMSHYRKQGFIPLRKAGKLPYQTVKKSYGLEYGVDVLEIHSDAVEVGEKVLLVDDVLATGGTLVAAISLLKEIGAEVTSVVVLMEIESLGGRQHIEKNHPDIAVHSLMAIQ